jgi:hypothetical protein
MSPDLSKALGIKSKASIAGAAFGILLVALVVTPLLLWWAWNSVIVAATGASPISFWGAFLLCAAFNSLTSPLKK